MNKRNRTFFWIVVAVVSLGMISRFFEVSPNISPVLAVLLFGAAYIKRKSLSILLPVGLYFLGDLYLNNVVYAEYFNSFQVVGDLGVYASFLIIIPMLAITLKKVSIPSVLLSALGTAVLFFLITNFFSMILLPVYPKTMAGLMESYTAGLPFFRSTIASTLIYSAVLFTSAELYLRQPSLSADSSANTIEA